MGRREELKKIAHKIAKLLKEKYKVKRVFLIGSVVRGPLHDKSDIDIVVEGLAANLYMRALTEIYDILPTGIDLNLIPFEDAFVGLKEKTLREGLMISG
ncbi:MAG: nucleotidyltransferase family protein [Candidatus Helarchaeota archaeon]